MDRTGPHRLRDCGAGRHPSGRLVRRLLGVRQRKIRPVHVRDLSDRRALAADAGRRVAGGAADPDADAERAAQGSERSAADRRLADRVLLPAGRRRLRPGACGDGSLGRPAGHVVIVFRGDRRVAAARHRVGAWPPLQDAGCEDAVRHLHRNHSRHSADHRSVHGQRHAAPVPAAWRHIRQIPARPYRCVAVCSGLYG
jgi:hypothetical protein